MGRRRRDRPLPPNSDAVDLEMTARLRQLLADRWQGNLTAMSRSIGASCSSLSRAIAGAQNPSYRMLKGLAGVPGVDLLWLMGCGGTKTTSECIDAAIVALEAARRLSRGE